MAKRDKLTHRQKRQVAKQQQNRVSKRQHEPALDDLSEPFEGLLVSRYGEQADVYRLDNREKYRCYLRQNIGAPVTGDKVSFRIANNQQGIVEALLTRSSLLQRPSAHQGLKPVVANIDQVFVVIAPLPEFSATVLDRYLVAIRDANINATIVANKWELEAEVARQKIEAQLKIYQSLGYPLIKFSSVTQLGKDELLQAAVNHRSILVGQSGVGKSSIINQLFPQQSMLVNQVSENSGLGQHTTTASQLFLFEEHQGFIVDSPGIREFGLWHMDKVTVASGFVEFDPYIGTCKYRDCQHVNEPGCAILQALGEKKISLQRWQNYCKIISEESK